MNVDKIIATIEEGFRNPDTIIKRVAIPNEQMAQYDLRRVPKDLPHYFVWLVSVGERDQQPTAWFMDRKLNVAFRKALAWRGVQPYKRKTNGAQQDVAATK